MYKRLNLCEFVFSKSIKNKLYIYTYYSRTYKILKYYFSFLVSNLDQIIIFDIKSKNYFH